MVTKIEIAKHLIRTQKMANTVALDAAQSVINYRNQYNQSIRVYLRIRDGVALTETGLQQMRLDAIAAAEQSIVEADRFRPAYAPKGQLTKSQSSARVELQVAKEIADWYRLECMLV